MLACLFQQLCQHVYKYLAAFVVLKGLQPAVAYYWLACCHGLCTCWAKYYSLVLLPAAPSRLYYCLVALVLLPVYVRYLCKLCRHNAYKRYGIALLRDLAHVLSPSLLSQLC